MTVTKATKSVKKTILEKGYPNGSKRSIKIKANNKPKPKSFTPGSVPGKGKKVRRAPAKLEYNNPQALRHQRASWKQRLLGTRGTPMADGQSQLNKPKVSHFSGNNKSHDNYKFNGGFKRDRSYYKGAASG